MKRVATLNCYGVEGSFYIIEVHRAVHRDIISIVKPNRCTNVSNVFFILEWHSTCFWRSSWPSSGFQDCTYSNRHVSNRYCCPLASRQQYLFDKCQLLYIQSWNPDDGRKDRPKHVECHSKIKLIWYSGASSWFHYRNDPFIICIL